MDNLLSLLQKQISGEVFTNALSKTIYATDASVYMEYPIGVVYPKSSDDIQKIVQFAHENSISLIPRAGGTSLAGQCVGTGLVVDVSKHLNKVIDFNKKEQTVTVQPGIIRDELNHFLKEHDLFFSPITSTANRATIGGMIGNNSCGTNSIVYGNTRDYTHHVKAILSDGTTVEFGNITKKEFEKKLELDTLEGSIYRQVKQQLTDNDLRKEIQDTFPKQSIHRRNSGYAIDEVMHTDPFVENGEAFNFSKVIAGSEGTLAFITEVTVGLSPIPPKEVVVELCHFDSINECMRAVTKVMKHKPFACELVDKIILDCTKENIIYQQHRSFFEGDPAAALMVEFRADTIEQAQQLAKNMSKELQEEGFGYAYKTVQSNDTKKLWELRSAGLGLLANIPGDAKGVACIEDTAVDVEDLADYIEDFTAMMKKYNQEVVYYAHAGAGEIHLRPILNLKKSKDREDFYNISLESAKLVKKYKGSLSGEHGDGRVRSPFIPVVMGDTIYQVFKDIKKTWDPKNILNPNKIVDSKPINTDLRYEADVETPKIETLMDFSDTDGILRMAEKCNGSGDCRKLSFSGGTMCPSFQATRNEQNSTRARANTLRTFLTKNTPNPFNHPEIKEVLDLCLSCKGCTSECPSNVDMTSLKAEFLHQYYKSNKLPLRSWFFAHINTFNQIGSLVPSITNFVFKNKFTSGLIKKSLEVAPKRDLPLLEKQSLYTWYKKEYQSPVNPIKTVYVFCDEFTNYNDATIGKKAVMLLHKLGYEVKMLNNQESGRAAISKGLLPKAKKHAEYNINLYADLISEENPLIGIEPSALLGFRDEYLRLVPEPLRKKAKNVAKNTLLIEEFLAQEISMQNIQARSFATVKKKVIVHGHCHQKSLTKFNDVKTILSLPKNFEVELLNTGCCGMAGSFGYEKEHYELSMQIGEMELFPQIQKSSKETIIVASGTSCRHQIKDGTNQEAKHLVEVLFEYLTH